jgi:hypothetical protein
VIDPWAVELPKIEHTADMVTATAALVDAAACGVITPAEAAELGKLIDVHARAIETHDFEARIAKLHDFEARIAKLEGANEESKQ